MAGDEMQNIRAMLAAMREAGQPSLPELRTLYDGLFAPLPLPGTVALETIEAGGVPAERLSGSAAAPGRTILYLHGGGYVIGSPRSHRHLTATLVDAAGATLIVPDYRLAPEHPYPAALDDALAAYESLLENGQDPDLLVVAGDSAGGGLTLATLIAARDKGLDLPAAAALISPWVDLAATGASLETARERDPIVQKDGLLDWAGLYLAGRDAATPLASPLYADLAGLPPLLIQVGTEEVLLDDAIRLDERARAQGVATSLEIWDDMIHVWHFFHPQLEEGRQAIGKLGQFVRDRTASF
jgi:acetyl esterase/lipase